MKNVQNFRNQINRTYRNATNSMRYAPLSLLLGVIAFGAAVGGYFRNLVSEGAGPFAGLNRGQLRRMSFLFAMYRC
jgi:hypothetical protein